MKKEKNMLKKKMTKKLFKEQQKANRSQVGLNRNLGTRYIASPKDYDRNKGKAHLRKLVQEAI